MKIAVVAEWFSDGMGYSENFFPKALGKMGHEVHLLTSDLQVYATWPDYDRIYKSKLGERKVAPGVRVMQGFTLERMRSRCNRLGICIPGLNDRLRTLKAEVVYCFEVNAPTTVQVAKLRRELGFAMFCESRLHASVLPPLESWRAKAKWALKNWLVGTSNVVANVERYYPMAPDVMSIITSRLGVPADRCALSSLAVETDIFSTQANLAAVGEFRRRLGFQDTDIVCIYTGRFTPDKGPHVLATAIDRLQARGHGMFRGLFVGQGDKAYTATIAACRGCTVHPFVEPSALANIYHSADIGVWPRQESTSQLDAMACGLPLVINSSVEDPMRLGETSLTFEPDDAEDLALKLSTLQDAAVRRRMGDAAAERIRRNCSWDALAASRLRDFERAIAAPTI